MLAFGCGPGSMCISVKYQPALSRRIHARRMPQRRWRQRIHGCRDSCAVWHELHSEDKWGMIVVAIFKPSLRLLRYQSTIEPQGRGGFSFQQTVCPTTASPDDQLCSSQRFHQAHSASIHSTRRCTHERPTIGRTILTQSPSRPFTCGTFLRATPGRYVC